MANFPAITLQRVLERDWSPVSLEEPLQLDELPTPALVLNLPAFERNLATMVAHLSEHGKAQRPHAKTHKCPLIAKRQIEAGAVGVCAAKLGEVAALVAAGVDDVLVTSPLTSPTKVKALSALLERSHKIKLVVDSLLGMDVLEAGIGPDQRLGIVVDIDFELGRTGTRDDELVEAIIARAEADPRFSFEGIQHYAGHLMHVASFKERRDRSLASWETVLGRVGRFAPNIVTGGGTGTFDIDVAVPAITDLQVGSYVFMDREYQEIEGATTDQFTAFESSLTVACTMVSAPKQGLVTVDGGFKAFASDTVAPLPVSLDGSQYHFGGDEHGFVVLPPGHQEPLLGQVHQYMVPHCDPTVNLHDFYWVQEADGLVHSLWPITARGCSW